MRSFWVGSGMLALLIAFGFFVFAGVRALFGPPRPDTMSRYRPLQTNSAQLGEIYSDPSLPPNTVAGAQFAFSHDGRTALIDVGDGQLRVWDLGSGREVRALPAHPEGILSLAVSPDGHLALTAGAEGALKLWNLRASREEWVLPDQGFQVRCAVFSGDGHFILTGHGDRSLRLRNVENGRESWIVSALAAPITAVAIAPDGRHVLTGDERGHMQLWKIDLAGPPHPIPLRGHSRTITAVAFAPDGKTAISAGQDSVVRLWDVARASQLREFNHHANWVTGVAYSGDGQLFLSASDDLSLIVHNPATREIVDRVELWKSGDAATAIAFLPDRPSFLVGTSGGVILRFDLAR